MPKTGQIGQRLRDFAQRFGGPSALSRRLEITPQQLNDYLTGRKMPGWKMQERLRAVGCDIEWLMTGNTKVEYKRKQTSRQLREPLFELYAPNGVSPETYKRLARLARRLRKLGANDIEKIDRLIAVFLEGKKE